MNKDYTFFWKGKTPFSQWYGSWLNEGDNVYDGSFVIADVMYITAEHYMMAEKARLFKDYETCEKILESFHPGEAKQLGREVKGFKEKVWKKHCKEIVFRGNYAKFTQHKDHKKALLDTDNTLLVEASPNDDIWGIGLNEKRAKDMDPSKWPGLNYLGRVLTKVRDRIRLEESMINVLDSGYDISSYRYRLRKTNGPEEYYLDGHDFGEYFYKDENLSRAIDIMVEEEDNGKI